MGALAAAAEIGAERRLVQPTIHGPHPQIGPGATHHATQKLCVAIRVSGLAPGPGHDPARVSSSALFRQ